MSTWWVVATLGAITILIRATGTVAFGNWRPSARANRVLALIGPAVLAALIVIQVFTTGHNYVLDERAAGLGAAGLAALFRAPLLALVACAIAASALTHVLLG